MQNLRLKAKPFCYLNSLSLKNIYLLNVTTIYETHRVTFIRLARCIVQTFCCHWQSESAYQVLLIRLESEARKKNFAKKRSLLNSNFFLRKIIFSLKQISTSKLRVILSSFLLFPSIRSPSPFISLAFATSKEPNRLDHCWRFMRQRRVSWSRCLLN